ncbi:hypothetical protein C1646_692534 [Rhizophagus diaphanus]|nr:hypothetical protein C1646_692534 [Rhizophagus diaphanus] [Rhizophagus sp. MUCL 43196]
MLILFFMNLFLLGYSRVVSEDLIRGQLQSILIRLSSKINTNYLRALLSTLYYHHMTGIYLHILYDLVSMNVAHFNSKKTFSIIILF